MLLEFAADVVIELLDQESLGQWSFNNTNIETDNCDKYMLFLRIGQNMYIYASIFFANYDP